jgi:hypothetical protein
MVNGVMSLPDPGHLVPPTLGTPVSSGAAQVGDRLRAPSIGASWDSLENWRELYRWRWQQPGEPSNTLESRVVVSGLRHLGRSRSEHGKRIVFVTDNLCALAIFARGRSSRSPLSHLARVAAALIIACGWTVIFRWVESHRNHSDGPSRMKPLGYYSGP